MIKHYSDSGIAYDHTERLDVIYNGFDASKYRPDDRRSGSFKAKFGIPEDTKIISFIGRFSFQKLPFLFVDIARNIIRRHPYAKLKFVMAGDGEDFAGVKEHHFESTA